MATMVENAQEMIRLAVRVRTRQNIGLMVQMHFPEKRYDDDPADPVFSVTLVGEAEGTFSFDNPNKATAFITDLDTGDTDFALQKAMRRERRQQIKARIAEQQAEEAELDLEFDGEG